MQMRKEGGRRRGGSKGVCGKAVGGINEDAFSWGFFSLAISSFVLIWQGKVMGLFPFLSLACVASAFSLRQQHQTTP
jgi:hypothetical protein